LLPNGLDFNSVDFVQCGNIATDCMVTEFPKLLCYANAALFNHTRFYHCSQKLAKIELCYLRE